MKHNLTQPLQHTQMHLRILWITDKLGNFTKNKFYMATPRSKRKDGTFLNFRILDDDGDFYTLDARDEHKYYEIKPQTTSGGTWHV